MIEIRGFADQKIEKTMLLLLEEVGELAKSIRKNATNMRIDNDKINHYDTIESEIADVFIVLSSICNKLGIDLFKSIKDKEEENIKILKQYTNISDKEAIDIKSLRRGECLMMVGEDHILAQIDSADYEKNIIE